MRPEKKQTVLGRFSDYRNGTGRFSDSGKKSGRERNKSGRFSDSFGIPYGMIFRHFWEGFQTMRKDFRQFWEGFQTVFRLPINHALNDAHPFGVGWTTQPHPADGRVLRLRSGQDFAAPFRRVVRERLRVAAIEMGKI